MQALIDRAEQLEMAETIAEMSEQQLETLAQMLYEVDSDAAMMLMRAIGFEDMESSLTRREGLAL